MGLFYCPEFRCAERANLEEDFPDVETDDRRRDGDGEALQDQGVDTIFGYPGGAVLPIYDALVQASSG